MEIRIKVIPNETNANLVGEYILSSVNPLERWGYQTEEYSNLWYKAEYKLPDKFKHLVVDKEISIICIEDSYEGLIIWHFFDGDGFILISCSGGYLINTDCKKSNNWEWV